MTDEQMHQYNEFLRMQAAIYDNRCPDGRAGCLVAHDLRSVVDALQKLLDAKDKLHSQIDWSEVKWKMEEVPVILNDDWIKNMQQD